MENKLESLNEFNVGDECVIVESGSVLKCLILEKGEYEDTINGELKTLFCFTIRVLERLNPAYFNGYPPNSNLGQVLSYAKYEADFDYSVFEIFTVEHYYELFPRVH